MTSEAIISVENLGKMYRLRTGGLRDQRYVALRDVLVEKATGLFRRNGRTTGQRDNETTGLRTTRQRPGSKEDYKTTDDGTTADGRLPNPDNG